MDTCIYTEYIGADGARPCKAASTSRANRSSFEMSSVFYQPTQSRLDSIVETLAGRVSSATDVVTDDLGSMVNVHLSEEAFGVPLLDGRLDEKSVVAAAESLLDQLRRSGEGQGSTAASLKRMLDEVRELTDELERLKRGKVPVRATPVEVTSQPRTESRHGVPLSWGGKVMSSQRAAGNTLRATAPTEDRIEQVSVAGLSKPIFMYGQLAVIPITSVEEFSQAYSFVRERRKSSRDKAVLVLPRGLGLNASPEVVARLANKGAILEHGEVSDPVEAARKYVADFAKARLSGRENLHAFMNRK